MLIVIPYLIIMSGTLLVSPFAILFLGFIYVLEMFVAVLQAYIFSLLSAIYIGIAINDAGYAQCMILQSGFENGKTVWKPQFLKIPYDNRKVAQDMITSGLLSIAPWFVNSNILTILTGIDCSAKMVELAEKLALEDNAQAKWPHIDEKYFEEAAAYYKIPDYRARNNEKER